MEHPPSARASSRLIGVAGRCNSDEEKAHLKQAVFLLRFRMKFLEPLAD